MFLLFIFIYLVLHLNPKIFASLGGKMSSINISSKLYFSYRHLLHFHHFLSYFFFYIEIIFVSNTLHYNKLIEL